MCVANPNPVTYTLVGAYAGLNAAAGSSNACTHVPREQEQSAVVTESVGSQIEPQRGWYSASRECCSGALWDSTEPEGE